MTNPFKRTTLIIVVAVVAISLIATVILMIVGDDLVEQDSAGVDSYSVSAIGHRGLSELLTRLDVPVVLSRADSGQKAKNGLLIVAEPTVTDDDSRDRLAALVRAAPRTLLVLPKWYGQNELGNVWIADADFIPVGEVEPVLAAVGLTTELVRHGRPVAWTVEAGGAPPKIREPQVLKPAEQLSSYAQDPDANVLVGVITLTDRFDDEQLISELWVLSDPDVLNNYGLRDPANVRFTVELIDRLREGGPVVIDETIHGYAQQPSLARTLLRFPLVLATMQVLICAVFAVWAAMVRFGPRKPSAPPIAPGKDFLVRNTAALLHYGGHHSHALHRYLSSATLQVRHTLHAPSLAPNAMTEWLERVRKTRGGTISLVDLETWVATADTPQRVVEVADLVFRWRTEMTHGTNSRS
ncbi:MAG: DUF4350 domain-containing protein [Kofleriaceae bacterium]